VEQHSKQVDSKKHTVVRPMDSNTNFQKFCLSSADCTHRYSKFRANQRSTILNKRETKHDANVSRWDSMNERACREYSNLNSPRNWSQSGALLFELEAPPILAYRSLNRDLRVAIKRRKRLHQSVAITSIALHEAQEIEKRKRMEAFASELILEVSCF